MCIFYFRFSFLKEGTYVAFAFVKTTCVLARPRPRPRLLTGFSEGLLFAECTSTGQLGAPRTQTVQSGAGSRVGPAWSPALGALQLCAGMMETLPFVMQRDKHRPGAGWRGLWYSVLEERTGRGGLQAREGPPACSWGPAPDQRAAHAGAHRSREDWFP